MAGVKETAKSDFTAEEPWRIFRIMSEFVEGFEVLSKVGPAVSIFGSSKAKRTDKYYKMAEAIAYDLARAKYAVITGAGPGIMEAANKGAKRAGGASIGLNIQVPIIQNSNPYITTLLEFRYFFCRRVMFVKYSKAFVILPGGFGTVDEFAEAVTLIQTERIAPFPVILVGKEYWEGLIDWMRESMVKGGRILPKDLKIFRIVDRAEDVVPAINEFYAAKTVKRKR